jgi:plasmid stabilization system protein ParE
MAAARRELRRAVDWYDREAPGLGDELASEVERSLQEVIEYPDAGSPHLANTRRVLTRQFPYSVIYQSRGDEIVVIAVAHQRRRPDFWLHRL